MKDKRLMSSFMIAHFGDIGSTIFGINALGFKEVGIFGSAAIENNQIESMFIFRTLTACYLIAAYSLTKNRNSRLEFSYEKGLKLGNLYSWAILGINLLQIAPEIIKHFHN